MLRAALERRGELQHGALLEGGEQGDCGQRGPPFGQGAGLVYEQRVDLGKALQGFGIAHQDAGLGARPVAVMTDIGVASPRAQGQAMIRTETAATRA